MCGCQGCRQRKRNSLGKVDRLRQPQFSRRAALFNLSQQSRQLRCFVCDSTKADPFQGRAVKHAKMQSASAPNRMAASNCGHAWPRPGGVLNCGMEISHVSAGEDLVKNRQWLRSRGVAASFTLRLLCDGGFKFRFTQSFDQDGHARLVQDFDKFQRGRFMRVGQQDYMSSHEDGSS